MSGWLPSSSSPSRTAPTALVGRRPETSHVFVLIGSPSNGNFFGTDNSGTNQGTIPVVLRPADERPPVTKIKDLLRPSLMNVPAARLTFDANGFGSGAVTMTLTSDDGPALEKAALALQREMHSLPMLANPVPNTSPVGPEIVIRPLPDQAARLAETARTSLDLVRSIRVATSGGGTTTPGVATVDSEAGPAQIQRYGRM